MEAIVIGVVGALMLVGIVLMAVIAISQSIHPSRSNIKGCYPRTLGQSRYGNSFRDNFYRNESRHLRSAVGIH